MKKKEKSNQQTDHKEEITNLDNFIKKAESQNDALKVFIEMVNPCKKEKTEK